MKKTIILITSLLVCFFSFSQSKEKAGIINKNQKGIITSVEFSSIEEKDKIPSTANAFFEEYLEVDTNDQFEKVQHKSKRKEFVHDHFDQYYNGVKVDGAGYNLHYKNGEMYFANGNFVKVDNINTSPSISLDKAIISFLNFKNIENSKELNTITELRVTDEFIVKFKENVSQKEIEKLHKNHGVIAVKTTDIYQLLKVPNGADALEIANIYPLPQSFT